MFIGLKNLRLKKHETLFVKFRENLSDKLLLSPNIVFSYVEKNTYQAQVLFVDYRTKKLRTNLLVAKTTDHNELDEVDSVYTKKIPTLIR